MDNEGLMADIQKKLAIWEPKDDRHCNRDIATKCWREIANQLNVEGLYKKSKVHLVKTLK